MNCRHLAFVSLVALVGCGAEVPTAPPSKVPLSKNPAFSEDSAKGTKPALAQASVEDASAGSTVTETAKPDKDEPVSKTASTETVAAKPATTPAVPALEEPTEDGQNWLKRDELEAGWVRLFDGQTLFGWKATSDLNWTVKDGVISADTGNPGLLCTTTRFADYELRCDYRVAKGGNSGIFLRTPLKPTDPGLDCYELNMCDTHPAFGTASLVKRIKPESPVLGDGEWHSFHVRLEGPKVVVQFDGQQVLEYTDTTSKPLTTGRLGLQMNGGKIEFRNIYLKPLGAQPLFDGQTLHGWREDGTPTA